MADFYSHSNERLQPAPKSRAGVFGRRILEPVEPGQVHAISRADRAARRGTWPLACTPNTHAAHAKNRFSSPTVLTRRSAPCAVGHGAWPLVEPVRPLPGNRGSDPKSAASCARVPKAAVRAYLNVAIRCGPSFEEAQDYPAASLRDFLSGAYSPAKCLGTRRDTVRGRPDPNHISTSFVEKHNQTMRQNMRRYTRLTAGHSKKVENHRYATALHFVHYNFARICQTIRCTPAMEAGISDHVWSIEELVRLSN